MPMHGYRLERSVARWDLHPLEFAVFHGAKFFFTIRRYSYWAFFLNGNGYSFPDL
jgi:hypothetical protein